MRRIFSLFVLFSLCVSGASGQASVWRVSGGGNTVYLAGSIHLLREKDYPLPDVFDAAFDASAILVLETDVDSMNDSASDYSEQARLKNGETLEDRLSRRTYRLLEKKAAELSLPIEVIRELHPAIVAAVFSAWKLSNMGFSAPGIDLHYLEKAKEESKPLLYLENVETHMAALFAAGSENEDEYVFSSLKDLDAAGTELITLIDEWKRGTGTTIERTVIEMAGQYPETYRIMIADRNRAWLPLIESYLASSEIEFVIAGTGHFYGPDGLLAMLAGLGYHIEQL